MGSFSDLGKKADELTAKAKEETGEVTKEIKGMSKPLKYIIGAVLAIAILATGSCMLKGCGKDDGVRPINGYQNPSVAQVAPVQQDQMAYQQPVAQQPVYVNNPDPMAGFIPGMAIGYLMSNGQRYDGHNGFNDSHYRGPSKTVIVNKYYGDKNAKNSVQPTVNAPVAAGGVQNAASNSVAKVKNPGDAQAAKDAAVDQRKAEIRARLEAARAAKAAPSTGGFSAFSKRATSTPSVSRPSYSAPSRSSSFTSSFSSPSRSMSFSSGGGGRRR